MVYFLSGLCLPAFLKPAWYMWGTPVTVRDLGMVLEGVMIGCIVQNFASILYICWVIKRGGFSSSDDFWDTAGAYNTGTVENYSARDLLVCILYKCFMFTRLLFWVRLCWLFNGNFRLQSCNSWFATLLFRNLFSFSSIIMHNRTQLKNGLLTCSKAQGMKLILQKIVDKLITS